MESIANEFAFIAGYSQPQYKSLFEYDKDTQSYIILQAGTVSASLKFLDDGGVRYIASGSSIDKLEMEYSKIDKTVVNVPASVKADVDAYIATKTDSLKDDF